MKRLTDRIVARTNHTLTLPLKVETRYVRWTLETMAGVVVNERFRVLQDIVTPPEHNFELTPADLPPAGWDDLLLLTIEEYDINDIKTVYLYGFEVLPLADVLTEACSAVGTMLYPDTYLTPETLLSGGGCE